jgi:hypothetical protein
VTFEVPAVATVKIAVVWDVIALHLEGAGSYEMSVVLSGYMMSHPSRLISKNHWFEIIKNFARK